MNTIIHTTGSASLVIQIVTSIIDTYVLLMDTSDRNKEVKKLLNIENIVNFIELFFYIWMVYSFSSIKNITKYRYYDWSITTPTMLFTYAMFLKITEKKEKNEDPDLLTLVLEEKYTLITVMLLNWLMLWFGYMSETGKMKAHHSVFFGFIPFLAMFYIIYTNYAQRTQLGTATFVFFFAVWALYGIAALLSYKVKNVLYNILDLFAKNFFGLFLAYVLVYT